MKRTTLAGLLIGAGALALIIVVVVIVAVSQGSGKQSPTPSATTTSSASSTPTSPAPSTTPPSPTPTPVTSPTTQPADHATVVARRGINPLFRMIERSCDEPDYIDLDGWRIDGDNVIYTVSDDDAAWTATATTSFSALEAGDESPTFVTDPYLWESNGCSTQ